MELIAQIVGLVAMAFNIFSYQQKKQRTVILFQFFGSGLFALNFFLLGSYVGALLNLIGVFRAVVFMNKARFRAESRWWLFGFVAAYLASYVLTFTALGKEPTALNLILEFLPVVGMTATTISFRLAHARAVRRYGLISSPSWLIYNIASRSVGAIACETFSLISILVGMWRLDSKRNRKDQDCI